MIQIVFFLLISAWWFWKTTWGNQTQGFHTPSPISKRWYYFPLEKFPVPPKNVISMNTKISVTFFFFFFFFFFISFCTGSNVNKWNDKCGCYKVWQKRNLSIGNFILFLYGELFLFLNYSISVGIRSIPNPFWEGGGLKTILEKNLFISEISADPQKRPYEVKEVPP